MEADTVARVWGGIHSEENFNSGRSAWNPDAA